MDTPSLLTASHPVRTISDQPGIHTYFDVIPESPDGEWVTWFQFDGKPLSSGSVMVADRMGERPIVVRHGPGIPHSGARQGWLDAEHLYFSMDGQVYVADLQGKLVHAFRGAVNTIHAGSRRGLAASVNLRTFGGSAPSPQACYRIDLDSGELTEILHLDRAWELLHGQLDLTGVPKASMAFKHIKWAPNGERWFVVFTNEAARREQPELLGVKTILMAVADGQELTCIGSFGHHPNWLPDSSGIYAFAREGAISKWDLSGEESAFVRFPHEGHPCVSPDLTQITTDFYRGNKAGIYLQDLASGETEQIVELAYPVVDWQPDHPPHRVCHLHPVWSRDGRRLYFNAVDGELPRFCTMEL